MPEDARPTALTVRCGFCGALNRVDLAKASAGPRCGHCSKPIALDRPLAVRGEDFDRTVLQTSAPVLVDFYADWCGPCRMVAPLVDEMATTHAGRLLVVKLDTEQAPEISGRLGIRGIPTLIAFRGGKELARTVGFDPAAIRDLAARAAAEAAA